MNNPEECFLFIPHPSAIIPRKIMATKSGVFWVTWANQNAVNSSNVEDLEPAFRANVKAFIKALEAAGAKVTVTATKRSARRAYLFHWSWLIALKKIKPSAAATLAGVDILWNHGNDAQSVAGALEIVKGFHLAVPPDSVNPPSLTSRHIEGKAIDMTITWAGTIKIKNKNGTLAPVAFKADGNANKALHAVGATYGVIKLTTDEPHWSTDGH